MYTLSVPHDKTRIHFKHYDKHLFLSEKSSCSFSVGLQDTRWRGEDSLLPRTLSCLTLLFMIALWTLSTTCSLYPNQSGRVSSSWMCNCFGDICVSYNFIFWLYNYCYYNNSKDNRWTCMHLSYVCYLAKFMNLLKKKKKSKEKKVHFTIRSVTMKGFNKRAEKRLLRPAASHTYCSSNC